MTGGGTVDATTATVAGIENGPAVAGRPGVGASGVLGVGYDELSPLRTQRPVYDDPVDRLVGHDAGTDVAHILATLAGYAYGDALTVSMMATRLGLERNRVRTIQQTVDAMFVESTAHVVQSACGRVVVLAYRGTEPTNVVSWLTDGDLAPEDAAGDLASDPVAPYVHAGFYRNVRATRFQVARVLLDALEGRAVVEGGDPPRHRAQALYFAGHSLGGAMALLHAVLLAQDAAQGFWRARRLGDLLRGVHTFGAPMAGTPRFAEIATDLGVAERVHRYVYRHDPVPALPPWLSGPYRHVGDAHRLGDGGILPAVLGTTQAALTPVLLSPLAFLARQVGLLRGVSFPYSLYDHVPQNYVAALAPAGTTEFGRPAGSRPPPPRS